MIEPLAIGEPAHSLRPRGRASGFTLIEVVLVIVIVGVVAAMAVPRYADAVSRYHADAAAQRLATDIRFAQDHARSRSQDTPILFGVSTNLVTIPSADHLDHPTRNYLTDLNVEPYQVNLTAADFDGDQTLIFDGYGQPDSGGTLTLRSGGVQRVLTVDADTGEVTIQ